MLIINLSIVGTSVIRSYIYSFWSDRGQVGHFTKGIRGRQYQKLWFLLSKTDKRCQKVLHSPLAITVIKINCSINCWWIIHFDYCLSWYVLMYTTHKLIVHSSGRHYYLYIFFFLKRRGLDSKIDFESEDYLHAVKLKGCITSKIWKRKTNFQWIWWPLCKQPLLCKSFKSMTCK
jgi:hypothetical protein